MVSPLPWPSSRLRPELLDGLVLARSAYHHSMNYRSVVVLGTAVEVTDETERLVALETISEHIIRGRWTEIRPPNPLELKATRVLQLPIEEASAKVRTGPPVDDEDTICAAGPVCCPSRLRWAPPIADPRLGSGIPTVDVDQPVSAPGWPVDLSTRVLRASPQETRDAEDEGGAGAESRRRLRDGRA